MRDATPEEHKSESDYFDRISTLVNSVVWKSADIHGNEEDHNLCLCRSAYNDFMFGNLVHCMSCRTGYCCESEFGYMYDVKWFVPVDDLFKIPKVKA